MNGRIYDPSIGRFLQADPFIQAPNNSQSFNRYSYVLNNPMSMTDPSGFISINPFKHIGRALIRGASKIFGKNQVRQVGNALSGFCGPAAAACAAYWNYEFTRAHGGTRNQALTGALRAAFNASGVNEHMSGFGQTLAADVFDHLDDWADRDATRQHETIAKTVGGTYSRLTGGKFANGAASKGLYNSMHPRLRQRALNRRISVETSGWWSNHVYDIKGQICTTDQIGCNDEIADRVFAHVDRNDVPFFGDDSAQGAMLLIPNILALSTNSGIEGALARYLGPQPIIHESFPRKRTSSNVTLPGHFFHYGDVTHRVYFEGNTLYYQVIGTGEGGGIINTVMGTELFLGGVRDVVNQYGL